VAVKLGVTDVLTDTPTQLFAEPTIPDAPTNTANLVDPPNWNKYIPAPLAGVQVSVNALSL
jgi:hypothetical protein